MSSSILEGLSQPIYEMGSRKIHVPVTTNQNDIVPSFLGGNPSVAATVTWVSREPHERRTCTESMSWAEAAGIHSSTDDHLRMAHHMKKIMKNMDEFVVMCHQCAMILNPCYSL